MDYQTAKVFDQTKETPKAEKAIAEDYQGRDIYPHEMVFVSGDGLIGADDTAEYTLYKVTKMTATEKIKAIEELTSYTVKEDEEIMKEIHSMLNDMLLEKISRVGIVDYFELTCQEVEDSL